MSVTIYYFTGTGNSLKISKDLASRFEKSQVISMTNVMKTGVLSDADTIVLVFPVYIYGLPRIVSRFVKEFANQMNDKYIAAIAANGGTVAGTLKLLQHQLTRKGAKLSAGFSMQTPSNFIVMNPSEEDEIIRLLAEGEKKVEEISSVISKNQIVSIDSGTKTENIIKTSILYRLLAPFIPRMDKAFRVNTSCIGCGICTKVCPVDNVTLQNSTPVWHHHCEQCFACINCCPYNAIDYYKQTVGKKRYHNPSIKIDELMKK